LELRLRFRGIRLRLEIGHDGVEVVPERPLTVRLGDGEPRAVGPEGALLGTEAKQEGVRA
jgi:hypothetical protein